MLDVVASDPHLFVPTGQQEFVSGQTCNSMIHREIIVDKHTVTNHTQIRINHISLNDHVTCVRLPRCYSIYLDLYCTYFLCCTEYKLLHTINEMKTEDCTEYPTEHCF